jgi:hypothetical protein
VADHGLDELRRMVVDDRALCERLVGEREGFVAAVIAVASERGIELSAETIEAELRDTRRERLTRWV